MKKVEQRELLCLIYFSPTDGEFESAIGGFITTFDQSDWLC